MFQSIHSMKGLQRGHEQRRNRDRQPDPLSPRRRFSAWPTDHSGHVLSGAGAHGDGRHDRQHRSARDPRRSARERRRAAVVDRRLHHRRGKFLTARRVDRRSLRSAQDVPGGTLGLQCRLVALQRRAERARARGVSRIAGARRRDAQPGGDVDHRQYVPRSQGARSRGRNLGGRVRRGHGGRSAGWRSIFWINIPIGVIALALTARFVRESRSERPRQFDVLAQVLVITALFALTSAVIDGRHAGWTSWPIAAGFATAIASAVGLVAGESRHREPLLDPRFFRSLPFGAATLVAVLAFAAFSGFLFLNSLYLQEARGLSASEAGLATLPIALALMVCSPLSGRLVAVGRTRVALVVAGGAIAMGALLLTVLAQDTPLASLLGAYGIFGIGLGTVNAPITNTAVSGMPRSHAGLASAVASTSRQVGASLGVALAGALAGTGIETAHRPDFAAATHGFFWVSAGLGVAIVVLGVASTGRRAKESAARVASLLDGLR